MRKNNNIFTIPGSFSKLIYPNNFDLYFKNEILIDRRNGKAMEMDAYSLFHALLFYKHISNINIDFSLSQIVKSIKNRLNAEDSYFVHDSWGKNEIHFRFTATLIQLIDLLKKEGISFDDEFFLKLIRFHLQNFEVLPFGIWFYHDSQEFGKFPYHDYHLRKNALGECQNNMLILNTHIHTLNTLILLNEDKEIGSKIFDINLKIKEGIRSLDYFIFKELNFYFKYIDPIFRKFQFFNARNRSANSKNNFFNFLFDKYVYKIRLVQKYKQSIFFHVDGYTEREVKLSGTNFHYHLINLNDLTKFLILSKKHSFFLDEEFENKIKSVIKKGLIFILNNSNYQYLLLTNFKEHSLEFCEVVALSMQIGLDNIDLLPIYCNIRIRYSATPLLKGFDKVYFPDICMNKIVDYQKSFKFMDEIDTFPVSSFSFAIININKNDLKFEKL